MSRTGANHPDANDSGPSTSREEQPDLQQLYLQLNEYLMLEGKFQPKLGLPVESESGEVTTGARDGAAHVLRCLKVWFDLPPDVLINAINLLDRFLTKMKVRPCHLPCITVSCMNIAIEQFAEFNNVPRPVSIEDLVSISQSACSCGDVRRMSSVIRDKLSLPATMPITALCWLRLFRAAVKAACNQLNVDGVTLQESELVNLLEIVSCDSACASDRLCELALVIVYHKLERELVELSRVCTSRGGAPVSEQTYYLYEFAAQLQAHCQMNDASLSRCMSDAVRVLARYEARGASTQKQRLVWRLSERTLKVLRPTDRLTSLLPTIQEQNYSVDATPTRNRSGSESSENEETSDWPRSPVLPVYCDN